MNQSERVVSVSNGIHASKWRRAGDNNTPPRIAFEGSVSGKWIKVVNVADPSEVETFL
jgi:hypothetical protein